MSLTLHARIRGSLLGAAIGAGLGQGPAMHPERYAAVTPENVFALELEVGGTIPEDPGRQYHASITPLIDLGVRAYVEKGGRVTPEDFARLFRDDAGIAVPAFPWDGLHTTQEVLLEGMPPRIAGLGNAPCGLVCAAMPAVGIYHHHDPDYAYLDGVELAAVNQPRLGSDWAGLCAAAVAAAFADEATPDAVVETILRMAFRVDKDLFYRLDMTNISVRLHGASPEAFAQWWLSIDPMEVTQENWWIAYHPVRFVLPLLRQFAADPRQFFALLTATPSSYWLDALSGNKVVAAVIGGAVLGALYGPDYFPAAWRADAAPVAARWDALLPVVDARAAEERRIIAASERLTRDDGGEMTLLQRKIYGCMLAGAIGNAMGSLTENMHYWEIDARYPDGIQQPLDPSRLETEDDNQMAMLLFETYVAEEGRPVTARRFGQTWLERLNRDQFFNLCMGNAYDLIRRGWDPRISGHWAVVTGSTVMCMEPVGVYHLADPEFAAIDATAIAYMYQRGRDVVAAAILASAVAAALCPDATVESVLQAALQAAPREPMAQFDRRQDRTPRDYFARCLAVAGRYDDVRAVRPALYDECRLYHPIDPFELLGFALAIFQVARGDMRRCAIGGASIGRDADTIAGRSAMLAGALNGPATVPPEWVALFKHESLERIRHNAVRLADQIAGPRLARLRRRQ